MSNFPILVKTPLIFPNFMGPCPIPKKGVALKKSFTVHFMCSGCSAIAQHTNGTQWKRFWNRVNVPL